MATAATELANEVANDPGLPELYTFAGYLGGILDNAPDSAPGPWRLLYLDAKLRTWLLVDEDSILFRIGVEDETSPSGTRDYIWMRSDASVTQGEGPLQKNEIQARFLRGGSSRPATSPRSLAGGTYLADRAVVSAHARVLREADALRISPRRRGTAVVRRG